MCEMKAMRFHAYGQPLQLDEVPVPVAGADEVLIKVAATGVNAFDWKLRSGMFEGVIPLPLPATPGLEASGLVVSAGANVTGVKPGDAVYGKVRGGYAEFALATGNGVAHKPADLPDATAAAIPVALDTAWSTLFDIAELQAGQRVLIHGAAGGVGSIAVQLAKWKGAYVFATASTANVAFVRSLGADVVIDYVTTPFD